MASIRNPGRVAGLWYLLLCLLGPWRLMYIPGKLIVRGNPHQTVANILAHEWIFRSGILTDLVAGVVLIFMTLAFYRLLKDVDQMLAVEVIVFGGIMPALINFIAVVSDGGALTIAHGADFLAAFDAPQRDALAMLLIRMRDFQNTAAEILWGVWLFPLAALVFRSGFLPRFLGIWLAVNGVAYVTLSCTGIFFPEHYGKMFMLAQPALLAELVLMLWLVIKGAVPYPSVEKENPMRQ